MRCRIYYTTKNGLYRRYISRLMHFNLTPVKLLLPLEQLVPLVCLHRTVTEVVGNAIISFFIYHHAYFVVINILWIRHTLTEINRYNEENKEIPDVPLPGSNGRVYPSNEEICTHNTCCIQSLDMAVRAFSGN